MNREVHAVVVRAGEGEVLSADPLPHYFFLR